MDHSDQMQDTKRTGKEKTAFQHTLRWCPASKLRDNLTRVCAWLLGALSLLAACPMTALGQESLPKTPARGEPSAAPQTERSDPAEGHDVSPEKRRILSKLGPQALTPEQIEEAERIRKLGAKYGTDPTAIVGRVQLSSTYRDLPQGGRGIDTVARVDLPFRGNYLLRVDAPFLNWSDPNRPGTSSAQGFSDLAVTAGWRAYNTPEYALLLGVISTFPTATESGLSLGKYTVGPTIYTGRFLPRWDSLLSGIITQQVSVGGDPARNSVNVSKAGLQINTFWGANGWSIVHADWRIDWERSTKSSMTLELELGRNVVGKWGVFVRPGIGIYGQDLPGAYAWNINGGIRYMFPSF